MGDTDPNVRPEMKAHCDGPPLPSMVGSVEVSVSPASPAGAAASSAVFDDEHDMPAAIWAASRRPPIQGRSVFEVTMRSINQTACHTETLRTATPIAASL